jgi:hypothetical protein
MSVYQKGLVAINALQPDNNLPDDAHIERAWTQSQL